MEPSVTMSRNQGSKIPDKQRASIEQRDGAARGTRKVDRRKKREIEKNRAGSALMPMEVGMSAELGRRGC
jgi:hypothetical protein